MGIVTRLDDYRPHIAMRCPDYSMHVVPVSLIDGIVDGKRSIDDIDDRDMVIRAILADWLMHIDP